MARPAVLLPLQVLHLLLSHKRGGVLAKGMVQALGADVPLGSTEISGERSGQGLLPAVVAQLLLLAGGSMAAAGWWVNGWCGVLHCGEPLLLLSAGKLGFMPCADALPFDSWPTSWADHSARAGAHQGSAAASASADTAGIPCGPTLPLPAVANILGEAAAHEEWTVQQMLLEAAKLEVQVGRGGARQLLAVEPSCAYGTEAAGKLLLEAAERGVQVG